MNCDLSSMPLGYADAFAWGWRCHELGDTLESVQDRVDKNQAFWLSRYNPTEAKSQEGAIDGWRSRKARSDMNHTGDKHGN